MNAGFPSKLSLLTVLICSHGEKCRFLSGLTSGEIPEEVEKILLFTSRHRPLEPMEYPRMMGLIFSPKTPEVLRRILARPLSHRSNVVENVPNYIPQMLEFIGCEINVNHNRGGGNGVITLDNPPGPV